LKTDCEFVAYEH